MRERENLLTHCNKVKQGQHGHAKVSPVPLVTPFIIPKEVVANNGKYEHHNEEQNQKVEYSTAECINESPHKNLEPTDEGYGTKSSQCA